MYHLLNQAKILQKKKKSISEIASVHQLQDSSGEVYPCYFTIFKTGFGHHWIIENKSKTVLFDIDFKFKLKNLTLNGEGGSVSYNLKIGPAEFENISMPIKNISKIDYKLGFAYSFRSRDPEVVKVEENIMVKSEGDLPQEMITVIK